MSGSSSSGGPRRKREGEGGSGGWAINQSARAGDNGSLERGLNGPDTRCRYQPERTGPRLGEDGTVRRDREVVAYIAPGMLHEFPPSSSLTILSTILSYTLFYVFYNLSPFFRRAVSRDYHLLPTFRSSSQGRRMDYRLEE